MRTALHIVALLIAAAAQLAATTVTGTLTDAFGVGLNCEMTITWRSFVASTGNLVVGGSLQRDIVNGVLSVDLQPNAGSDPVGTSYAVSFRGTAPQLISGCRSSETWVIPASGPVDVSAVRVAIAPTPTYSLNLNQISLQGAVAGESITYDGAAVVWDVVAGAGGGLSAVRESDLTPSVSAATILELLASEFVVTDQGAGVARAALGVVPEAKIDAEIARDSEIPANTDALTQGITNLYFSNALARAALSAGANVNYVPGTGVISVPSFPYGSLTGVPSSFPPDLTANYTWTGNHVFNGIADVEIDLGLRFFNGTAFYGEFVHFNTSNRIYTFPNLGGGVWLDTQVPNTAGDIEGTAAAGYTIKAAAVSATELDEAGVEAGLEAVLDLVDLQGNLTESRISDLDHLTLAEVAANANNFSAQQDIDGVAVPLRFGGLTVDANFVAFTVTDPTAPRTVTVPNANSAFVQPLTCGGTDKISSIGADGLPVCSADDGGGGGLANAYVSMTDGTTTASANLGDTFKFRSANALATVAVGSNDVTHGDNLLVTINEGSFTLSNIGGAVTDAQVPNTITIDLATVATTANAGDSATSFFPSGTLEDGLLSANVSLLGQTIAPAEMTAAARQETQSWNLESPTTGDTGLWQKFYSATCTMQRVWCSTDAGTATINLDKRAEATPNTTGTSILTANLVCDNTSEATTGFASAGVTQDLPVALLITAVAGATNLRVGARCQID